LSFRLRAFFVSCRRGAALGILLWRVGCWVTKNRVFRARRRDPLVAGRRGACECLLLGLLGHMIPAQRAHFVEAPLIACSREGVSRQSFAFGWPCNPRRDMRFLIRLPHGFTEKLLRRTAEMAEMDEELRIRTSAIVPDTWTLGAFSRCGSGAAGTAPFGVWGVCYESCNTPGVIRGAGRSLLFL